MSVDLEGTIRGVFADLDDGGLDESEALAQIRDYVGAHPAPEKLVFSFLVPVYVTVNVEEKSIEEVHIDLRQADRTDRSPTTDDGSDVDEDRWSDQVESALSVTENSVWPHPTIER